jgi:hypothetical protein
MPRARGPFVRAPALNQHLRLAQGVEQLPVEQLVA